MFGIPFLSSVPFGKEILVGVAVAAICLPLGYCKGQSSEAARQDAARAIANAASVKQDADAKEIAANERLTDATLVSEKTKELVDAVEEVPDSVPDGARVALGCERLRQQSSGKTALPAICGSQGGAKAGRKP